MHLHVQILLYWLIHYISNLILYLLLQQNVRNIKLQLLNQNI